MFFLLSDIFISLDISPASLLFRFPLFSFYISFRFFKSNFSFVIYIHFQHVSNNIPRSLRSFIFSSSISVFWFVVFYACACACVCVWVCVCVERQLSLVSFHYCLTYFLSLFWQYCLFLSFINISFFLSFFLSFLSNSKFNCIDTLPAQFFFVFPSFHYLNWRLQ